MAWKTVRAGEIHGVEWSWNYIVASIMRNGRSSPYTLSEGGLYGLSWIGVGESRGSTFDASYNTYAADTSTAGFRKLSNTQGSGAYGNFVLADWYEEPNGGGFKWDRARGAFTTGSASLGLYYDNGAHIMLGIARGYLYTVGMRRFLATPDVFSTASENTGYTRGFDNGSTASIGTSIALNHATNFVTTPMYIDLSFSLPEDVFDNGCKANYEFRNLVCAAAIKHSLIDYKHRWCSTSPDDPMTVNIRSGDLATLNPNAPNYDPILATYALDESDFTTPDIYGAYNTTATQSTPALASGTAAYAEMIGCYSSTGAPPRLYVPVGTSNADNQITLVSLTATEGETFTMSHCGFRFTMGV
ncbi:MAG: hypothetical protein KBE22_00255 [Candidatus Accumulibacter sp.]|nr:hypothetical protein [Accumulibacter sp.]